MIKTLRISMLVLFAFVAAYTHTPAAQEKTATFDRTGNTKSQDQEEKTEANV